MMLAVMYLFCEIFGEAFRRVSFWRARRSCRDPERRFARAVLDRSVLLGERVQVHGGESVGRAPIEVRLELLECQLLHNTPGRVGVVEERPSLLIDQLPPVR
jgi:hypothetical protein